MGPQDNLSHAFDEGGKEEFAGVLPLGDTSKEVIKALRIEGAFEDSTSQNADGTFFDKGLKDTAEKHGCRSPEEFFTRWRKSSSKFRASGTLEALA
jgi:hypothetical protein